jgi:ketosteroid isomerase-like protein
MSEENVEIVRNAFGKRALRETAEAYWHPEIEYVEDPRFPGASSHIGRDAALRCWQAYMDVLGDERDLTVTVENVADAGELQVPLVRYRGRSESGGVPWEHLWGYVVEVKDGRLSYIRAYYDPAEALEAAGLSE